MWRSRILLLLAIGALDLVMAVAGCGAGAKLKSESGVAGSHGADSGVGDTPQSSDAFQGAAGSAGAASASGTAGTGGTGGPGGNPTAGAGGASAGPGCIAGPVVSGNLTPAWAAALGNGNVGRMIVMPTGDIVAGGSFVSEIQADGKTFPANPASGNNPFLLVLDRDGHLRWERTFATNWTLVDVAVDASGDLFVIGSVGQYAPRADLGNGPIPDGLVVAKLDVTGKTIWSRGADGLAPSGAAAGYLAVGVSPAGQVVLLGTYIVNGAEGMFVALLDRAGAVVSTKPLADGLAPTVAVFDAAGGILVGGTLRGQPALGPTPTPTVNAQGFVAKLDLTGKVTSTHALGDGVDVTALATDGTHTFIAGSFAGTLALAGAPAESVGLEDLFVATFTDVGSAPTKLVTFPSSGARIDALAPDGKGGVLALANVGTVMSFGAGLISPSSIALFHIDAAGATTASAAFNVPYDGFGWSLALDGSGGVVAFGGFNRLTDLGTGPLGGTQDYAPTMFVSRYTQLPSAPAAVAPPCPPTVAGALLSSPSTIGLDTKILLRGDTLYLWGDDAIWSMPVAGGAPKVLAYAQRHVMALAADDTSLVWTTVGTPGASGSHGGSQVLSMPRAGGATTVLADQQQNAQAVALDGDRVLWITGGRPTVVGGHVQAGTDGRVSSVPRTGGAETVLATGLSYPGPLAVCARSVVFADATDAAGPPGGGVTAHVRALRAGETVPAILATLDRSVTGLACDGTTVFWTRAGTSGIDASYNDGVVGAVSLAGGTSTTLASGLGGPYGITIAVDELLWANYGTSVSGTSNHTGGAWRMPKTGGTPTAVVDHAAGIFEFSADDAHVAFVQGSDDHTWALMVQVR
jgi:hypothetical protein